MKNFVINKKYFLLLLLLLLFYSHLLPDYIVIQPMTRDAKEFLVIDRTHEDIQIHSKQFFFILIF